MGKELSVNMILNRLRAAHNVRVEKVPALKEIGTLFSEAADLIEQMDAHICELSGCSEEAES
jgi:hypothetical protein